MLRSTQFLRQVAATDKSIAALVYELYGLTDKEIRMVEYNLTSAHRTP